MPLVSHISFDERLKKRLKERNILKFLNNSQKQNSKKRATFEAKCIANRL